MGASNARQWQLRAFIVLANVYEERSKGAHLIFVLHSGTTLRACLDNVVRIKIVRFHKYKLVTT